MGPDLLDPVGPDLGLHTVVDNIHWTAIETEAEAQGQPARGHSPGGAVIEALSALADALDVPVLDTAGGAGVRSARRASWLPPALVVLETRCEARAALALTVSGRVATLLLIAPGRGKRTTLALGTVESVRCRMHELAFEHRDVDEWLERL